MQSDIDERAVVAFYGCHVSSGAIASLYGQVATWLASLGLRPDKMGLEKDGVAGSTKSFRSQNEWLQTHGFESVEGFSLFCLREGGRIPVLDWRAESTLVFQGSCCIIGMDPSVATIPGAAFESISRDIVSLLDPAYGIGFRRDMRLGPSLYAVGMVQGLQPWGSQLAEFERIDGWGQFGMGKRVYEQGLLRDVYRWNFLTNLQLNRRVEGIPLGVWIDDRPGRGTLKHFTGRMSLWEVADELQAEVRSALNKAGLLFSPENATR